MKIIAKNTQLLILSPQNGFVTKAVINTCDGIIESPERLKLVGFTFGRRPGV